MATLGRACLIKSETYFDAYDKVFAKVFKGVEGALGDDVTEEILEWLKDAKNFPELSPEELAELERLTSDELMRRFLETLAEQTERHDGGNKWVGTGGRSHGNFLATQPNSEVRDSKTFGVMRLTLHKGSYDWEFVPDTQAGNGK